MSWLLPSALAIAGVAAIGAIALHFIARSRPLAEPLPTARFIPQRPIRARTRSVALSDVPLLLLRLAAILLIGAAVAGPDFASAKGRVLRIVIADRSRAAANAREVRDSVRAVARQGDVILAMDSVTAAVGSLDSLGRVEARPSLSAALAAAERTAATITGRTDSVELVIVSPFALESVDAATTRIRATWPGRIRVVRTRMDSTGTEVHGVETRASDNDAVVAGFALTGALRATGGARLVRHRVERADSVWAALPGHVLIHWPDDDSSAVWPARSPIDAIGGVSSETGTIVARLPRLWTLNGRAIARWADGEAAATERAIGQGCIRDVGVLLDAAGDVTLHAPFRDFVRALVAPCGGARSHGTIDELTLASLAGSGPLAPSAAFADRSATASRWTAWLLLAAALLLIVELAARRAERKVAP